MSIHFHKQKLLFFIEHGKNNIHNLFTFEVNINDDIGQKFPVYKDV